MLRLLANKPQLHWSELPDLPIKAQEILQRDFAVLTSSLESCQTATEGDTTKLLIRLQDGLQVESVIMHYDTSGLFPPVSRLACLPVPGVCGIAQVSLLAYQRCAVQPGCPVVQQVHSMAMHVPLCVFPPKWDARWDVPSVRQARHCCSQANACTCSCWQLVSHELFSRAGTMGLVGNLTSGEILEQLVHALQVTQIHNIVFMVSCMSHKHQW